jgi:hypothetical protein
LNPQNEGWLSSTVYSIYWLLPFKRGGPLLHPQPLVILQIIQPLKTRINRNFIERSCSWLIQKTGCQLKDHLAVHTAQGNVLNVKITLNTHSVTKYADFVTLNKMVHKLNNGVQTVGIMSQGIFVEEIHAHSGRTNNATAALSSCNVSRQGRRMNLPLHSFLTKSKYFVWQLKENLDTQMLILSKQKF